MENNVFLRVMVNAQGTKSDFNIVLFVAIFIFLLQGFYFYVGLTTPGGKLYMPFLGNYLNFPFWLTVFVTKILKAFVGYMRVQYIAGEP